jgi:hypothetical protein
MDPDTVREHAQRHAEAMRDGDLRRAAADLSESGKASAPSVMAEMPKSIDSVDVTAVREDGGEVTAITVYSGEGRAVTVMSRWAEHGERPMITDLKIL